MGWNLCLIWRFDKSLQPRSTPATVWNIKKIWSTKFPSQGSQKNVQRLHCKLQAQKQNNKRRLQNRSTTRWQCLTRPICICNASIPRYPHTKQKASWILILQTSKNGNLNMLNRTLLGQPTTFKEIPFELKNFFFHWWKHIYNRDPWRIRNFNAHPQPTFQTAGDANAYKRKQCKV